MKMPLLITKSWISQHFNRSFKWIRTHLLTDEVLTEELDYDLDEFKRWQTFPPFEGNRLKRWLYEKGLLINSQKES